MKRPPAFMLALLLHGALLGAVYVGAAGLIEVVWLLAGFPYHRDPGLFLDQLPWLFAIGAVLGGSSALALRFLSRKDDRDSFPGMFLSTLLVPGVAALATLLLLHLRWLPAGVSSTSSTGLGATLAVLAVAALLFWVLRRIARSKFAWTFAGFFTPFAAFAGVMTLLVIAWIGRLMPIESAPLGVESASAPAEGAPNVLLVVLDTVSAPHLGAYGHYRDTSPELDKIAASGLTFMNAFSAAPWTLPSHASLFTGLLPTSHRTGWEHPRLEDGRARIGDAPLEDFRTLAEELGARGYQTCGVAQKSWVSHGTGLTQGFAQFWDFSQPLAHERLLLSQLLERVGRRLGRTEAAEVDKGAKRIIDQSLDWIDGGRGRDEDRPFFLFLNLNEAHDPFQPPAEYETRFLPEHVSVEDIRALDQSPTYRKEFICGLRDFEENERDILTSMYDAEIAYQDAQLGRLFQALRDQDLMEDTLVIVTSDHGEEFGEHDVLGHQLLLSDGMLRVPLIMRHPRSLPAGTKVEGLASLVDVFPTVIEFVERATGDPWPASAEQQAIEGVSLFPAWDEPPAPPRDFVVAHYDNCAVHLRSYPCWDAEDEPALNPLWHHAHAITCLRTTDRKVVVAGDGRWREHSLADDPDETDAGKPLPAMPGTASVLGASLAEYLNHCKQRRLLLLDPMTLWKNERNTATGARGETLDLQELGYLGTEEDAATQEQIERGTGLPDISPRLNE